MSSSAKLKKALQESKLAIALVLLVLTRCVDRVYNTRITYNYSQYLWYFSNIINPVAFQFICWPVVWYKLYYTEDITPAMKSLPHYKFIIMSFLDMASNLLSTVPIPHIGGNLSNVLGQVSLPFTMILSRFLLRTQYKNAHLVGAIMVLYGAFVCMIPIFRGEIALNSPDPTPFWIALYVLSCLPSAGAYVYKEIGMKDVDLDVWYANAWISLYQVGWGIVTMWTIRLPAFSDPTVEWADFPSYVSSAHNCFFGQPTTFNGVTSACDGDIFVTYVQYILFNIIFNVLMMYIFREGSSVMFVISSAVCLPLTDILYMIPALAGPLAKQKFTIFDGFALFVIMLGMLVYHSEKEERLSPSGQTPEIKSPALYQSPSVRRLKAGIQSRKKRSTTGRTTAGYGAVATQDDSAV
ncbi:Aste57867_13811 [Aphanomyces stellatus]|uniref:Aste57867_13811 protein n=1 Tax=Aphanomyces stellatus TaxID=120398 RepID=A0A485KZN2_9STRA|nr:hypothetical protein As57867_013761 [Aphanomyces stellatus]VFT90643.1 Aste57867_13811 [Aphanomyces stellatus]